MIYVVYLDEFGHIGPFISKDHKKYHESPVFGLAGYILPIEEVRNFGTWFFKLKCNLLDFEIKRSGEHPSTWEKKGSSLYTIKNVTKYRELRLATNRILNKINFLGGHTFYVGIKKSHSPEEADANALYHSVLKEALKRLNDFCENDAPTNSKFLLILDEHDQRDAIITTASRQMYGGSQPMRHMIEPPFQIESHRYQTAQASDWISGLVGRIGAIWAEPTQYKDNDIFRRYFEARINKSSIRSGIRTNLAPSTSAVVSTPLSSSNP